MSINDVEKIVGTKLQPYVIPDSLLKNEDSAQRSADCKNCTATYLCPYKAVNLLLTFFRYTIYKQTDFELEAITPFPPSPLIQTKTGIAIGITEKKFLAICKENQYPYKGTEIDEKSKGYIFSDDRNNVPSKTLMATFSDGKLVALFAVNMIGD